LLGKEMYDLLIDDAPVSKGMGRAVAAPTRSATRGGGTRGSGGGESLQEREKTVLQHAVEDLHDFTNTRGFWTCAWAVLVTVRQHDGKDDETGERIESSKIGKAYNYRRYRVDVGQLIRVTIKNVSKQAMTFLPVYVSDTGDEEPEEMVTLKQGEDYEMPYPLQKDEGEEEDAWAMKDEQGKTKLMLRFAVAEP
jgi:hypothetical protein